MLCHVWLVKQLQLALVWILQVLGKWQETSCTKNLSSSHVKPIYYHMVFWALSCSFITSQICFTRLRSGEIGGQDINWNWSTCFHIQHNSSLVIWDVILLKDFISSEKYRRRVRVLLICKYVLLIQSFRSLFCDN